MSFGAPFPPGLVFLGQFESSGVGARSFAGLALGPESPERIIIVAVSDAAGTPPSTVTITPDVGSPVSATVRVGAGSHAKIFTALVPTGTTATVDINGSSATLNSVGVYALYGSNTEVPVATATGTNGGSLNAPAHSFVVACVAVNSTAAVTWSGGLTQDYNSTAGGVFRGSSASAAFQTAQTPLTVGTVNGFGFAMACWTE